MRHISNFFPVLHSFWYLNFSIYFYLWAYFSLLIHNIKIMKAACHQAGTFSLRKFNESTCTEIFLSILRYNLCTKEVNSMHFNNQSSHETNVPQSSYNLKYQVGYFLHIQKLPPDSFSPSVPSLPWTTPENHCSPLCHCKLFVFF